MCPPMCAAYEAPPSKEDPVLSHTQPAPTQSCHYGKCKVSVTPNVAHGHACHPSSSQAIKGHKTRSALLEPPGLGFLSLFLPRDFCIVRKAQQQGPTWTDARRLEDPHSPKKELHFQQWAMERWLDRCFGCMFRS